MAKNTTSRSSAKTTKKAAPQMPKRVFKTTKKLTSGGGTYRKWADWTEGDVLICKFVSEGVDTTYGKPTWTVKVEEAMFSDEDAGHVLKGKNLTLNSNGQFDKAMAQVSEGDMIQITYNGVSEIEKGKYRGKDAHQVEVELVVEEGAEDSEEYDSEEESTEEDDI